MSLLLADKNRRETSLLAGSASGLIGEAWRQLVDPYRLDRTTPAFLEVATAITLEQRARAARAGAEFYVLQREARGIKGEARVAYAADLDPARLRSSLLVTGPVRVKRAVRGGAPIETAFDKGASGVIGAAFRHVADGNRGTIRNSVRADRQALGYARVSDGNPCPFCAMLISRGAVYKGSSGEFTSTGELFHDRCGCSLQPVYRTEEELPSISREAQEIWQDATLGKSNADARRAFARAWRARQ